MNDIQAGKVAEAAQLLENTLRSRPKDAELCNLLGIAYSELHRAHEAESAFSRGLAIAPDSVSLNENAGLLYFQESRYADAKKKLLRAVELGSTNPGVLYSLAASRLRMGEHDVALQELRSLEPRLANVPDYWIERGRAALPSSPGDAETSFEKALQLSPGNIAALNGLASAAERQGLDEKALSYLLEARKASPDNLETLLHFASVCIRRDLGPDALDAAEKARQIDPQSLSALYLLARANISVQNWQRAYDLFRELTGKRPGFAPAFYALGWLDIRLGRTADARKQLQHALALDPKLTGASYELAQLELDDGNMTEARELLTAVLRETPNDARANMTMGDLALRAGKLDEARSYCEKAVSADPALSAAHYKLATVYSRLHEASRAEQEHAIAAQLTAQEKQQSKTQLRLVLPD